MKTLLFLFIFGCILFTTLAASRGGNICTPPCVHGSCIPGNSCLCPSNGTWAGQRCEIPQCSDIGGCGTGECIAPDNCNCTTPGWTGNNCQTPVCQPVCGHGGNCTGVNACSCSNGWTGSYCETAICSPSCLNGGYCIFPPTSCNCTDATGWNGSYCQDAICTTVHCQNGGYCSGPNVCDCEGTGYGGFECQTDVNECQSTDPLACDPLTNCTNTIGSYYCSPCPDYYTGTGKTGCTWDACGWGACSPLVSCNEDMQTKTFQCGACPTGYTGNGTNCTDIDECLNPKSCDPLTNCTNTPGGYLCGNCPKGYTGNGKTGCSSGTESHSSGQSNSTSSILLYGIVLALIKKYYDC